MHPAPGVPRGTTQTRSHPGSEPDGHPRHVPRGPPPSDSGVSLCSRTPSTGVLPSRGCQDLPDTFHVEHGEPQSALAQRSALGRSTWNTLRPRSPSAPGTNHLRPPHPEGRGECPSRHVPRGTTPSRSGSSLQPRSTHASPLSEHDFQPRHVPRGTTRTETAPSRLSSVREQPHAPGSRRSTWNLLRSDSPRVQRSLQRLT